MKFNTLIQITSKKASRTAAMLTVALLCYLPANGQQQQVTINGSSQSLSAIFKQIENQTDMSIDYNANSVDASKVISNVPTGSSSVNNVLEKVLSDSNIEIVYQGSHIILKQSEASNIKVSGTVVDSNNQPIIGATVVIKGTSGGTITDANGKYELTAPSNSVFDVSSFGYETQSVNCNKRSVINVTLEESSLEIEELVVVAFGKRKKSNLATPISSVSSEDMENRPVTNVGQALQGILPGINLQVNSSQGGNVNSTLSMQIRGTGTIGSDSDDSPLVLIDGVEGDMNMINPQDIESVTLLKDASASSIYGSRAAFGVLLITTKQGKTGKLKVNYNGNIQLGTPNIYPEQMDSYTYVNYMNQAYRNDGLDDFFPEEQVEKVKLYQQKALYKDGSTTFDPLYTVDPQSNGQYRVRDYWGNTDWFDILMKDVSVSQEHNLSINGGKDDVRYYMSLNYLDRDGQAALIDDSYKRYNFNARINAELKDWLSLESITRFSRTDYETATAAASGYSMWGYIPTTPLYDPFGNYGINYETLLPILQGGRTNQQTDVLTQSLKLVAEPIKNWTITAEATYRINTFFENSTVKEITAYYGTGEPYNVAMSGYSAGYTQVKESVEKANFFTPTITTNYNFTVGDHEFDILAGMQSEQWYGRDVMALQDGLISSNITAIDATNGSNDSVSGGYSDWATAGVFGRLNYSYKQRYVVDASIRYDGSSRFTTDQRWQWFPTVSAAWNISNEKFMEPVKDIFNQLKLRGSLGALGNQNTTDYYPFYSTMPQTAGGSNWLVGGATSNIASIPSVVSSSLTWERIRTYNVGLDFSTLKGKLALSFDYFYRYTDDMVGPGIDLPNTFGADAPVVNNADLLTKGFELELSYNDRLANGFGYGAKFVLQDATTEVLSYPNDNMTVGSSTYYAGQKIGEIWGYTVLGIAQTQAEMDAHIATTAQSFNSSVPWAAGDLMYKDVNGDKMISNGQGILSDMGDMSVIGNETPRFNFGMTLNADYKGFALSALFTGVMKRDYWTTGNSLWGATGGGSLWGGTGYMQHLDYFRPEGTSDVLGANTDAYFPAISYTSKNTQVSDMYLQDASYIKLKNIQLSYTFPANMVEKMRVTSLKLYASIDNVWTSSKIFDTIDPEMLNTTRNFYPLNTVSSIGVNITF